MFQFLVGCPLQEADFSGLNENHAKQHEVLFSRLKRGELSFIIFAGNCSLTSNTKHINIVMKCVINLPFSCRSWTYKMCYWPTVFTILRLVTAKAWTSSWDSHWSSWMHRMLFGKDKTKYKTCFDKFVENYSLSLSYTLHFFRMNRFNNFVKREDKKSDLFLTQSYVIKTRIE